MDLCSLDFVMAFASARVLFSLRVIPRILANFERHPRQLTYLPSRSAGHSHWQNVRHTKEAKDRERARVTSNFLLQIDAAIKRNTHILLILM